MAPKIRLEQYHAFQDMLIRLLVRAQELKIILRLGEAHRPKELCDLYAKEGKGIEDSEHRYSLAIDLWIVSGDTGTLIDWRPASYKCLGEYWESVGGEWGGRYKRGDPCHFQIKGKHI